MSEKSDLARFAADVMTNPKAVAAASTAAVSSGMSAYLDILSDGIGLAASAAGLLLAVMMIRKVNAERIKLKFEISELKAREELRIMEAEYRKSHDLPVRRCDDEE